MRPCKLQAFCIPHHQHNANLNAWMGRDLNALFEELVRQSGSISEQEFWAGRQHLLRKQQGESGGHKQKAGVGNAMLLAMRPSADGRTNTVGDSAFHALLGL